MNVEVTVLNELLKRIQAIEAIGPAEATLELERLAEEVEALKTSQQIANQHLDGMVKAINEHLAETVDELLGHVEALVDKTPGATMRRIVRNGNGMAVATVEITG